MRNKLERLMLSKTFLVVNAAMLVLAIVATIVVRIEAEVYQNSLNLEAPTNSVVYKAVEKKVQEENKLQATEHVVRPNSSIYQTFLKAGVSDALTQNLVEAAKPLVDLAIIKPKTKLKMYWDRDDGSALQKIELPLNKTEDLVLFNNEGEWHSRINEKIVDTEIETYQGKVVTTLWDSATNAGINGTVISKLADVFAWQIDFSREIRYGDTWRISIERKVINNRPIGWGSIVAAEFINAGEKYTAIRYKGKNGRISYYDQHGESLKKIFLKNPVRFSRITSGFSRKRMHPILKVNRPHRGVDYAASRGTPVRAVGDGRITVATYSRSSGNYIKIAHNSTYSTSYHHLHKFAKGIKKGKKINQGDIIGYVGSTGLATGPHLHFAFYVNGRFTDPLGMKFPSADPISSADLDEYKKFAADAIASLPSWQMTDFSKKGLTSRNVELHNENSDVIQIR
ncbi:MAG: peptidoglycan DD-metalloendopeptidase family protein [Bdellovibrionota bacterium]